MKIQGYSDLSNKTLEKNLDIDQLIEALKPVVEFASKTGKPLSVCGEVASIQEVAVKFYEIGIRKLSISPSLVNVLNASYTEFKNK